MERTTQAAASADEASAAGAAPASGAEAALTKALSVDYSADELDALASAFLRPELARRPERAGGSAVQRAQHQTALRGLVARHAIALGGTPTHPRITFLEPHATLLDAFLNAGAVATIRTETPKAHRAVTLFASADAVVHRSELPGQQIHRLTAYPRVQATDLLRREVGLSDDTGAAPSAGRRFDLARAALRAAVAAVDADRPTPRDVPQEAFDVLYARRSSASVAFSARSREGGRILGTWTWIDAGQLGRWQLVPVGHEDQYVSLQETTEAAVLGEVDAAWAEVLAESAPV